MTSVLYSSGLNYQGRNPMGNEIRGLERRFNEFEGAFTGMRSSMQKFLDEQKGGADVSQKMAEMQSKLSGEVTAAVADMKSQIAAVADKFDSLQTTLDILKLRLDKAESASASASAAATAAKTLAMQAAADAASAVAAVAQPAA